MTILGAIVQPDQVVAWTDTQTYAPDGTPSGRFNKLRLAACGPVIGFGGGWHDLLRHADEAADRVASALRQHMLRAVTAAPHRDPGEFGHQLYVVAGWSPRSGRMLAYRLSGSALFCPILEPRIASPWLDRVRGFAPTSDRHVAAFAQHQVAALREHCPAATGGDLLIGIISSSGTFIRAVRDFAPLDRASALGPHMETAA